jgi:hypothetical protein
VAVPQIIVLGIVFVLMVSVRDATPDITLEQISVVTNLRNLFEAVSD